MTQSTYDPDMVNWPQPETRRLYPLLWSTRIAAAKAKFPVYLGSNVTRMLSSVPSVSDLRKRLSHSA
jgi:hypothetical protein